MTWYNGFMLNKIDNNQFLLVTYPRTGSHFLHFYLKQLTGFSLEKTHFPRWGKGKKVITIIRDPQETIKSGFAMHQHAALIKDKNWVLQENKAALLSVNGYIDFFDYMIKNADVIIDYNTLINSPYSVCKFLAEYIGIEIKQEEEYIQVLKDDNPENNPDSNEFYLVSSKTSPQYDNTDISWIDFSEHYKKYYETLARKTI
jgi:hypothetical protein